MNRYYYRINNNHLIHEFKDDYAYFLKDSIERETLALGIANDIYEKEYVHHRQWPVVIYLLDDEKTEVLWSFEVNYWLSPEFELDSEVRHNGSES